MLNNIIKYKTFEWLQSNDCSVKNLISYIRNKGELRDTQIQAIETYLFLKIKGENKPLWQLFSEGFFIVISFSLLVGNGKCKSSCGLRAVSVCYNQIAKSLTFVN